MKKIIFKKNKKSLVIVFILIFTLISTALFSFKSYYNKKIDFKPRESVLEDSITNYFPFYDKNFLEFNFINELIKNEGSKINGYNLEFFYENNKIKINLIKNKKIYTYYYKLYLNDL